jgi:UDP-glucose 4-epimerase
MKMLVTGSAGHRGEAHVRSLLTTAHDVIGVDVVPSPFTHHPFTHSLGPIVDRAIGIFSGRRRCGVQGSLYTVRAAAASTETSEVRQDRAQRSVPMRLWQEV